MLAVRRNRASARWMRPSQASSPSPSGARPRARDGVQASQPRVRELHSTRQLKATRPRAPDLRVYAKPERATFQDGMLRVETASGQCIVQSETLWWRDVCECPRCVDPVTKQKHFDLCLADEVPEPRECTFGDDGSMSILWERDQLPTTDDGCHRSEYPRDFLQGWRRYNGPPKRNAATVLWNRDILGKEGNLRSIAYPLWKRARSDGPESFAFWKALVGVSSMGVIKITRVPDEVEPHDLASSIGPVDEKKCETRRWLPAEDGSPYTVPATKLHTAGIYQFNTPGVVIIHCRANKCDGGELLVTDGFRAAHEIELTDPDAFQTLLRSQGRYQAVEDGMVVSKPRATVSTLSEFVTAVAWSPRRRTHFYRAPETYLGERESFLMGHVSLKETRRAFALFDETIARAQNVMAIRLNPGEAVVVNNHRILHGFEPFTVSAGDERRLEVSYVGQQTVAGRWNKLPGDVGMREAPATAFQRAMESRLQVADQLGVVRGHVQELTRVWQKKEEIARRQRAIRTLYELGAPLGEVESFVRKIPWRQPPSGAESRAAVEQMMAVNEGPAAMEMGDQPEGETAEER